MREIMLGGRMILYLFIMLVISLSVAATSVNKAGLVGNYSFETDCEGWNTCERINTTSLHGTWSTNVTGTYSITKSTVLGDLLTWYQYLDGCQPGMIGFCNALRVYVDGTAVYDPPDGEVAGTENSWRYKNASTAAYNDGQNHLLKFQANACFLNGTMITTKEGNKKIEDIREGELVLSFNEATKTQEYNPVLRFIVTSGE